MPSQKNIEIGHRIRELRGVKSQLRFAFEIGISLRAFKYYESGERVPPVPVLAKIAAISDRSVDWILTGQEPGAGADRVAEVPAAYGLDDVTQRVVKMMSRMTEEDKREVLKYASYRKHEAKKKLKEGA